jgi:outer membrane protein TolC
MKKIILVCLLGFLSNGLFVPTAFSQLTLEQAVSRAQSSSPLAFQAKNERENRYWQYQTYKAGFMPQLRLLGELPSFNSLIQPITLPDGSQAFVNRSFASSSAQLELSQVVSPLGTRIFASSQLQRIDIYGTANTSRNTSYASRPVVFGFQQPIFVFNPLRWDRKIEPLRFEESQKRYNEEFEAIAQRTAELYFNLLTAQVSAQIAQKNLSGNDTIYLIGKGRYSLGKIAENDLLQLQLNVMTAQQQLVQAQLDVETNTLVFNTLIGNLNASEPPVLAIPEQVPAFEVDEKKAIEQAKQNRERYVAFSRQKLEADRDVARAIGNGGLNVDINASYGLNSTAQTPEELLNGSKPQQFAAVSFNIPILDWGLQKARVKTAQSNREWLRSSIDQEMVGFEQEIYVKVKQFKLLREQLKAAELASKVAQKRFDISQQRYFMGQISITDFNIALQEKDRSQQSYLLMLKNFWVSYYELRRLTLYDFSTQTPIVY